jgi:hypothetical protein
MLAYNIIRQLMMTAAAKNGVEPRAISYKGTLQALTAFREALRTARADRRTQLWDAMFVTIAYDRVGDRPGRIEPRAKKRRPKQYDLLNIPRNEARNRLFNAA